MEDAVRFRLQIKASELRRKGWTKAKIAESLGFSVSTLSNWIKNYPEFATEFKQAEKEVGELLVEDNLIKLAKGYEVREVTREYFTEESINGEDVKVKKTEKIKEIPTDIKALQILARRFSPDLDDTKREILDENLTIRISQKDRALTLEERQRMLGAIDDCEDIIIDDFEVLSEEDDSYDI